MHAIVIRRLDGEIEVYGCFLNQVAAGELMEQYRNAEPAEWETLGVVQVNNPNGLREAIRASHR